MNAGGCDRITSPCIVNAGGCDRITSPCIVNAGGWDRITSPCIVNAGGWDRITSPCIVNAGGWDRITSPCIVNAGGCKVSQLARTLVQSGVSGKTYPVLGYVQKKWDRQLVHPKKKLKKLNYG